MTDRNPRPGSEFRKRRNQSEKRTNPSRDRKETLNTRLPGEVAAGLLGIIQEGMDEVIPSDLKTMLENNLRQQMDGYVLCMARILEMDRAWSYIEKVFSDERVNIPETYFKLFNRTKDGKEPPPPNPVAAN